MIWAKNNNEKGNTRKKIRAWRPDLPTSIRSGILMPRPPCEHSGKEIYHEIAKVSRRTILIESILPSGTPPGTRP